MTENTMINELYQHTIDMLQDMKDYEASRHACDLHHYIFNEDYYIIGHHNARKWIKKHDLDVFEMIDRVVQYEQENFGKSETEITPENVVNMFVYIEGEEILHESEHLQDVWNDELTTEDYEKIIKELS